MRSCYDVWPREAILEDILGDDHVGLTILYCPRKSLTIMTIWKWLLVQTTMDGFSLKELLISYDETYMPKKDIARIIGIKKKNFNKRKWKEIMSLNFVSRIEKLLNKESCRGVEATMCSLNCYQNFPCKMMKLLRHEFWNKSFEEKSTHMFDILRRRHQRGDYTYAKFAMFQEMYVHEIA
jgi:hypothetical protein